MTIKDDEQRINAYTVCSDNIKAFLTAIDNKDSRIKWSRLERDGCMQSDGSFFRVICSKRSATEQIKEYKRGRSGVKYQTIMSEGLKSGGKGTGKKYVLLDKGTVTDAKEISTNAWAGASYHNYGLAVDLVLRKFGDAKVIQLSDGAMTLANYYSMIGLTQLAKDCGVEWGGLWTEIEDVAHWQDTAYPQLLPDDYRWTSNFNYEFLARYYAGDTEQVNGVAKTISRFKALPMLAVLGLACLFFKKGGKKWDIR